jgi:hypothetical protein
MYRGFDLTSFFAKTPQKLSLAIAEQMKGRKLRKFVISDSYVQPKGSNRTPWSRDEVLILRKAVRVRCQLTEFKLDRLWPDIKEAINAKGRHQKREWVEKQTERIETKARENKAPIKSSVNLNKSF